MTSIAFPTDTDQHTLTSERRDGGDRPTFRPRCSCGWFVKHWVDRATATELGDDHIAANTPRRLPRAEVITLTEPAPEPTRAERTAAGLRQLADFIEANPEQAEQLTYSFANVLALCRTRDQVVAWARAGKRAGAKVTKYQQGDSWAGVKLDFGHQFIVDAYAPRDEICERIVTGTREVTEEVPEPEALAAVPKVTVTKTVEDVTWRCLPLLGDEAPGGAL